MLQWNAVQHKLDGEFHYSMSLVDIEDKHIKFVLSIALDLVEGSYICVRSGDNTMTYVKPSELIEFMISMSFKYNCLLGYAND